MRHFLIDENCFENKKINLISHNIENIYDFRTPTPFKSSQLKSVGEKATKIIKKNNKKNKKVQLIGISSRGIPLAVAVSFQLELEGIKSELSIIKGDILDHVNLQDNEKYFTVLIDNSIKSGSTIRKSIRLLNKEKIYINLILHLYDFCVVDKNRIDQTVELAKEVGIKINAIFSFKDILIYFRKENKDYYKELSDFGIKNGNKRIIKFLNKK